MIVEQLSIVEHARVQKHVKQTDSVDVLQQHHVRLKTKIVESFSMAVKMYFVALVLLKVFGVVWITSANARH